MPPALHNTWESLKNFWRNFTQSYTDLESQKKKKMSGTSPLVGSFVAADYAVFAFMLVVSASVGIYYAWVDRGQRSSGDFLMGGRKLTAVPVSLSLTASFMSAITVLSNPAEVRKILGVFEKSVQKREIAESILVETLSNEPTGNIYIS